jgi:hypothetical protein
MTREFLKQRHAHYDNSGRLKELEAKPMKDITFDLSDWNFIGDDLNKLVSREVSKYIKEAFVDHPPRVFFDHIANEKEIMVSFSLPFGHENDNIDCLFQIHFEDLVQKALDHYEFRSWNDEAEYADYLDRLSKCLKKCAAKIDKRLAK